MRASYANFGNIPYGHSIVSVDDVSNQAQIGRLYYDAENDKGCNAYTPQKFEVDMDGDVTPFMLADRGECTFVQKVRNMQRIGVSVAIIIDNKRKEDVTNVVMSDDGTGGGISIAAMLISYEDGQILKNFLQTER